MTQIVLIFLMATALPIQLYKTVKDFKSERYQLACISSFVAGFAFAAWLALLLTL